MDESPSKRTFAGPQAEAEPFPGQMSTNYPADQRAALQQASRNARASMGLGAGRVLGKTQSAPVVFPSSSGATSMFTNPSLSPVNGSPTRAPFHPREVSQTELQPMASIKPASPGTGMDDGFDVEDMEMHSPSPSPRKRGREVQPATVMEDEGVSDTDEEMMDQDSPTPSPKKPLPRRTLDRAVTEGSVFGQAGAPRPLDFNATF